MKSLDERHLVPVITVVEVSVGDFHEVAAEKIALSSLHHVKHFPVCITSRKWSTPEMSPFEKVHTSALLIIRTLTMNRFRYAEISLMCNMCWVNFVYDEEPRMSLFDCSTTLLIGNSLVSLLLLLKVQNHANMQSKSSRALELAGMSNRSREKGLITKACKRC